MNKCKKCLLNEAGEKDVSTAVREYIGNLDDSLKIDKKTYNKRLSLCRLCDNLISGCCVKCGCYVETRAALKASKCADDVPRW